MRSGIVKVRNYGWKAHLLAQHSFDDLAELERQVKEEHANPRDADGRCVENGRPTIFLYDTKGMKKLDALSWAVYHKTKKKAA